MVRHSHPHSLLYASMIGKPCFTAFPFGPAIKPEKYVSVKVCQSYSRYAEVSPTMAKFFFFSFLEIRKVLINKTVVDIIRKLWGFVLLAKERPK